MPALLRSLPMLALFLLAAPGHGQTQETQAAELRIAIKPAPPFVIKDDAVARGYRGLSVDLIDQIAARLDPKTRPPRNACPGTRAPERAAPRHFHIARPCARRRCSAACLLALNPLFIGRFRPYRGVSFFPPAAGGG